MKKVEKEILEYICKNYLLLGFIFVTFFALIMRFCCFSFVSDDFTIFLSRWFDYLKNNGGILALGSYKGDYNAPYMTIMALLTYIPIKSLYLIKFVSVVFDFGLAISSAALVKHLVSKNKSFYYFLTYSIMLFIPEIVMNSAIWGQCDSGYSMFAILAILYLIKEDYLKSFIFLGISFALKLQVIFILPLFIVIYFAKKEYSILHFLLIPIVNFILCIPAILFGKPIGELLLVYFYQVVEYKNYICFNFLNIYGLIGITDVKSLNYVGIFTCLFICLMALIYIIYKKVNFNNKKILNLGLWFVVITTFVLPSMHERYLYIGCCLSVIYYITYKENFILMLTIIICSILTYFNYLFGLSFSGKEFVILGYMIVIAYYTKYTFNMLCNNNNNEAKEQLYSKNKL